MIYRRTTDPGRMPRGRKVSQSGALMTLWRHQPSSSPNWQGLTRLLSVFFFRAVSGGMTPSSDLGHNSARFGRWRDWMWVLPSLLTSGSSEDEEMPCIRTC